MDPHYPHLIPHPCRPAAPAFASRRWRLPSPLPFLPPMLPSLPLLPPMLPSLPLLPPMLPMLPLLPRSCRASPVTYPANSLESSIRPRLLPIQNRKAAKTAMFTNPVNITGSCAPDVSVGVRYVPFSVDAACAGAVACGHCGLHRREPPE